MYRHPCSILDVRAQKELQRKSINVINEKESIKTKKEKIESRGVFERLFNIN